MKNFKLTLSILFASAFMACKKKDATPDVVANARITQIITSATNSNTAVQTVSYDTQGRNTDWKYDGLTVFREYTVGSRVLRYQYILNNEGLAVEGGSQSTQENYRRKFTYDEQKRIKKITIEEQYVSSNGTPNTNYKLSYTYDVTWSAESNISSIRATYTGDANTGGIRYWIYNFEGYSANYLNTLKAANIGMDIFGPQGFTSKIESGGNGGMMNEPLFAGAQLPTKVTIQGFAPNNDLVGAPIVTNYTYEKDSQNRITLINYDGVTFRFNYK